MARRLDSGPLVVASHNAGKVREIGDLLRPFGLSVRSAGDLSLPEPEETGETFVANALLKAQAAATAAGLPALADDSGLAVAALGGEPGIYSARWAGPERDFALAMQRVEERLAALGTQDRRAAFVCALALAWPDGHAETFEGRVEGALVWPPRGDHGFGYDPVFVPDSEAAAASPRTFAEMAPEEKHAQSHRARAFALLVSACLEA